MSVMARGNPTTIPVKMISDIPLPIPRSVICSPSHMMNAVPVVRLSMVISRNLMRSGGGFVLNPGIGFLLMTMLSLTTGTAFIMWLGEQITERGIGNGMSLIIFAGIVVGIPNAMNNI